MQKGWYIIFLLVLLLLGLPKLVLPRLVEHELEQELQNRLGSPVMVDVKSRYGWDLVFGKVSFIAIEGHDWHIDGLAIDHVCFQGEDFRLDVSRLIWQGEFVYIGCRELIAELVLTEVAIDQYLWDKVDPNRNLSIGLQQTGASLSGEFDVWGTLWTLNLSGEFRILDQTSIIFVPKELIIADTRVPSILLEIISEHYALTFNLGELPLPLKIDSIELADKRLVLYGSEVY